MTHSLRTLGRIGVAGMAVSSMMAIEIDIHGFASQSYFITGKNEYLVDDSSGGSFAMNDAGINFGADLTDDLRVGLQLYARDLGEFGNNVVNLDWAFLDYAWKPELSIRAGRIKATSGFWREYQDYDFTRTWALLPTRMYDPSFRDLSVAINGASAYGYAEVGSAGALSYQATIGTANLHGSGDLEVLFRDQLSPLGSVSSVSEATMDFIINGQVTWETPIEDLRLNATVLMVGPMNTAGNVVLDNSDVLLPGLPGNPVTGGSLVGNTANVLIDWETFGWYTLGVDYYWDDWYFVFEYGLNQQKGVTTTTARINDVGGLGTSTQVLSQESQNLFTESMYWGTSYRYDDNWQFGSYLELYFADRDDRLGKKTYDEDEWRGYRYDLAVSARYDVNDNWLWKVEFHGVRGTAGGVTAIPGEELSEYWWYFVLKTTVNF